MEPVRVPESGHLTINEVVEAIEALTDHDYLKLIAAGRAWAVGLRDSEAEDLLHEALTRLVEDRRHMPASINFMYGIMSIMQSLANERREQQMKFWVDNSEEQPGLTVDEAIMPHNDRSSVERRLVRTPAGRSSHSSRSRDICVILKIYFRFASLYSNYRKDCHQRADFIRR